MNSLFYLCNFPVNLTLFQKEKYKNYKVSKVKFVLLIPDWGVLSVSSVTGSTAGRSNAGAVLLPDPLTLHFFPVSPLLSLCSLQPLYPCKIHFLSVAWIPHEHSVLCMDGVFPSFLKVFFWVMTRTLITRQFSHEWLSPTLAGTLSQRTLSPLDAWKEEKETGNFILPFHS